MSATNVARGQTGKHLCRQHCVGNNVSSFARALKLVYLNGNNAAEGENNIKYANSYPMNRTVKN